MKRLLAGALALLSFAALAATTTPVQLLSPTGSAAGQAILSTGPTSAPAWGGVTVGGIAAIAANTVLANATGSSAAPTAFAMPSCSGANNALRWTSGTGFACASSIALTSGTLAQFAATTSTQLLGVISDETGSGALVFGTTPTLSQPNIVGTTTNNSAAAGSVGEYVSSSVVSGSAVSLTTSTAANITSISLTAGDWDVSAVGVTIPAVSTTQSNLQVGISTTSATQPSLATGASVISGVVQTSNTQFALAVPPTRISISGTTTVYLVVTSVFAVSTNGGYGTIRARRIR